MKFALYVALFFFFDYCIAQDNQFYIKPEVLIGKTIPSYTLFTHKKPKTVLGASLFKNNYNKSKNWQRILNYPKTGISVYFTNYGDKAKGNSFSVLPFINFYVNQKKLYSLKFAFGASYFTKQFDVDKNPNFNAISTKLTWCLQAGIYRKILHKNKNEFFLGLVYFHHSNGHTKLPNEGFNTASISFSTDFKISSNPLLQNENIKDKKSVKRFSGRFINIRYGKGFHVLQETTNRIKPVEIVSISGGIYYKEIVRLSIGAAYRFYQHYYDYILDNQLQKYLDNPTANASNMYMFLGAELLLGNVGIDWEGGLNLYKPFYKTHYQLDSAELNFNYKLKKIILGRLGLKLYAISTSKKPKHNVYLSGNINSNFGQADFSEISIGIIKRLR
jgi:hypothetical protein